ncbi:MAG: tail family protein [Firmicutes bacterium]|nr:tail family protein [Bacillota bacterium]
MASTYKTKQGDTWDLIAYKQYGDEYKMQDLIEANPDYVTTVIFSAGIELTMPDSDSTTATNLPPWKTSS